MGQNVTISSTPPAAQLVFGDPNNPVPGVLVNNSPTGILYLANDVNVDPNDPIHNSAVPPGQYVSFDGTTDLYGLGNGTPIPVAITFGLTAPPTNPNVTITGNPTVLISGTVPVSIQGTPTVAITGTPTVNVNSVSGNVNIGSVAGNVDVIGAGGAFPPGDNGQLYTGSGGITPGNSLATGVLDGLNYNAYNLAVDVYCATQANAGAPIVGMILINWYADAAGATTLYTDAWWVWAGNSSANSVAAVGSGPMHGRYFQVFVFNQGTSQTLSCSALLVYGTQRTLNKPVWRQGVPIMTAASGFTQLATLGAGNAMGTDDVLATNSNQGLNASTKYFLPMPLSAGPVYARFETSVALSGDAAIGSADNLQFGQIGGTAGSDPHVLVNFASAAGTDYETNFTAAHAPIYATISTTATAPTINLIVTSQDAG